MIIYVNKVIAIINLCKNINQNKITQKFYILVQKL